ncbi:hypothetical protein Maq22A_c15155 [Methylobacterium aquaticum]|uniref:Uncharacterized protein n=1 Tax=Methylobacterium aquaticum TaxID=270351 RepID=A0A0C6FLY9_9HYPH|nr:hypothetical protein [Methylobacterium aquaticum]BAQ46194.1 hypothetical protein Maq22A_c15155 [Methylobacterium aquaticum]
MAATRASSASARSSSGMARHGTMTGSIASSMRRNARAMLAKGKACVVARSARAGRIGQVSPSSCGASRACSPRRQ